MKWNIKVYSSKSISFISKYSLHQLQHAYASAWSNPTNTTGIQFMLGPSGTSLIFPWCLFECCNKYCEEVFFNLIEEEKVTGRQVRWMWRLLVWLWPLVVFVLLLVKKSQVKIMLCKDGLLSCKIHELLAYKSGLFWQIA